MPEWLAEVVRPRPAPVPWPEMIRAAVAICGPRSVSLALGQRDLGVLPAMGGILGEETVLLEVAMAAARHQPPVRCTVGTRATAAAPAFDMEGERAQNRLAGEGEMADAEHLEQLGPSPA